MDSLKRLHKTLTIMAKDDQLGLLCNMPQFLFYLENQEKALIFLLYSLLNSRIYT